MAEPKQDLEGLFQEVTVRLYHLDLTDLLERNGNPTGLDENYYFCEDMQTNGMPVLWQGQEYQPWPIETQGINRKTTGTRERPQITLGNVGFLELSNGNRVTLSQVVQENNQLRDVVVTVIRTLRPYLDNEELADPTMQFKPQPFSIDSKPRASKRSVTFELRRGIDQRGTRLPNRPMTDSYCVSEYRSDECGYVGSDLFDSANNPTLDPDLDVCSQSIEGCRVRFGEGNVLNAALCPGLGNQNT